MKKNTKKMIRLAAILYCVLLCVVLISTLAWFVLDEAAGIQSADNMTISAGIGLEISLNGTDWDQLQKPTISYSCPDITGDGVKFYYPQTLDENDENPSDFLRIDRNVERDKYYIDIILHFKTNGSSAVYLTKNSFVSGVKMDVNDAIHGKVPNDAIAGAVRVAFYDITEIVEDNRGSDATKPAINAMNDDQYASALKCIWIPNDKFEISQNKVGETDQDGNTITEEGLSFNQNGAREDSYGYLIADDNGTTYTEHQWTAQDYASGKVVVGNDGLATKASAASGDFLNINNAVPLLDFSVGSEESVETIKTMLIRIWVEGTDREAHTYLNSGEVKYKFEFVGIDKSATTDDDANRLNGIKYNSGTEKLLYSDEAEVKDSEVLYSYNGIDWENYTPSMNGFDADKLQTNSENKNVIYIKLQETTGKRPSGARELEIETTT